MLVSDLLQDKGDLVVTIHPDASLEQTAKQLSRFKFGVLVASEDGKAVTGILSERDIVRRIAEVGAPALKVSVRSVMTRNVFTCGLGDTLDSVMQLMDEKRIRHVPVVQASDSGDDELCGMVSMTDLVGARVKQLEQELANG